MNRIFVDLDGVLVNFGKYKEDHNLTSEEVKETPGAYFNMEPIPGAIEAVRSLAAKGFDIWIATKPPTGVAFAYADKVRWVLKHMPELARKIIITHDKGMLGDVGDYLCDDRPHKANASMFPGTFLRFVDGFHWPQALEFFKDRPLYTEKDFPTMAWGYRFSKQSDWSFCGDHPVERLHTTEEEILSRHPGFEMRAFIPAIREVKENVETKTD